MQTKPNLNGIFRNVCIVCAAGDVAVAECAAYGSDGTSDSASQGEDVGEGPGGIGGGAKDFADCGFDLREVSKSRLGDEGKKEEEGEMKNRDANLG